MPNTLAHIAVNGITSKKIVKNSPLPWIYLGCIIPDFPWIVRKIAAIIFPAINGYDLHAFVIVQATLFFSLILSGIFSLFAKNTKQTFIILALGSLLHLLLDPTQIKWANGVHLFAPFSWQMTSYGFYWPENFITYSLTFLGLLFFIINWKNLKSSSTIFEIKKSKSIYAVILVIIYFLMPFLFMSSVYNADNHFLATLKNEENRTGKYVELDRKDILFNKNTNSNWIKSFNNDVIELKNVNHPKSKRISVKGKFETNNLINVEEFHENWELFRDGASYLGLFLVLLSFLITNRKVS